MKEREREGTRPRERKEGMWEKGSVTARDLF